MLPSMISGYASHLTNMLQGVFTIILIGLLSGGHQVGVTGRFRYQFFYRFKGTINYVSADICWFKDMI